MQHYKQWNVVEKHYSFLASFRVTNNKLPNYIKSEYKVKIKWIWPAKSICSSDIFVFMVDIFIVKETKLHSTFPTSQFLMDD